MLIRGREGTRVDESLQTIFSFIERQSAHRETFSHGRQRLRRTAEEDQIQVKYLTDTPVIGLSLTVAYRSPVIMKACANTTNRGVVGQHFRSTCSPAAT